jgi:hypothetical protein
MDGQPPQAFLQAANDGNTVPPTCCQRPEIKFWRIKLPSALCLHRLLGAHNSIINWSLGIFTGGAGAAAIAGPGMMFAEVAGGSAMLREGAFFFIAALGTVTFFFLGAAFFFTGTPFFATELFLLIVCFFGTAFFFAAAFFLFVFFAFAIQLIVYCNSF